MKGYEFNICTIGKYTDIKVKSTGLAPNDLGEGKETWGSGGRQNRRGDRVHASGRLLGECGSQTESDTFRERATKLSHAVSTTACLFSAAQPAPKDEQTQHNIV